MEASTGELCDEKQCEKTTESFMILRDINRRNGDDTSATLLLMYIHTIMLCFLCNGKLLCMLKVELRDNVYDSTSNMSKTRIVHALLNFEKILYFRSHEKTVANNKRPLPFRNETSNISCYVSYSAKL